MASTLAVDVAFLLPPDVDALARRLNKRLATEAGALRLDDDHLPHISVTQQFVREDDLAEVITEVERVIRAESPLRLRVEGLRDAGSVQIAIAQSGPLQALHELLMGALEPFEQPIGTTDAFLTDGDPARAADVLWVTTFRLRSAYARYSPHVTLGHGDLPDGVEPFEFSVSHLAVCHLGRYCTCRRILHDWNLAV